MKLPDRLVPVGLVAERELRRLGRRWQTWAGRAAVVAGLVVVLAIGVGIGSETADLSQLAKVGEGLFTAWSVAFLFLAQIGVPLAIGASVIDEREAKTLDALDLASIGATRVLAGHLGARLLQFLTHVAGGLPLLVVTTSLGGTGPLEALAATVLIGAAGLQTGAVASFVAIYATSPVQVATTCFGIQLAAGWASALAAVVAQAGASAAWAFSPAMVAGATAISAWSVTGPLVFSVAVAATVLPFAGAMLAGRADEAEAEAGTLGRLPVSLHRRAVALVWIAVLVGALIVGLALLRRFAFVPTWLLDLASFVATVAIHVAVVQGLLMSVRRRALKAAKRRPGRDWRKVARIMQELPASPRGDGLWGEHGGAVSAEPIAARLARLRASSRAAPVFRVVGPRPVYWREKGTRAARRLRGVGVLSAVLAVGVVSIALFAEAEVGVVLAGFFGALGVVGAVLMAAGVGAASVVDERKAGTLPLLLSTALSPLQVAGQKVAAALSVVAPMAVVGALLGMLPVLRAARGDGGPLGVRVLPLVATLLWALLIPPVGASLGLWIGAGAGTPNRAYGRLIVVFALLGTVGMTLLGVAAARSSWELAVLFPFFDAGLQRGGNEAGPSVAWRSPALLAPLLPLTAGAILLFQASFRLRDLATGERS